MRYRVFSHTFIDAPPPHKSCKTADKESQTPPLVAIGHFATATWPGLNRSGAGRETATGWAPPLNQWRVAGDYLESCYQVLAGPNSGSLVSSSTGQVSNAAP